MHDRVVSRIDSPDAMFAQKKMRYSGKREKFGWIEEVKMRRFSRKPRDQIGPRRRVNRCVVRKLTKRDSSGSSSHQYRRSEQYQWDHTPRQLLSPQSWFPRCCDSDIIEGHLHAEVMCVTNPNPVSRGFPCSSRRWLGCFPLVWLINGFNWIEWNWYYTWVLVRMTDGHGTC
jgi:hypothetical protein